MSPFAESTVAAARANLDSAQAALRSAVTARTERGAWALVADAIAHVANAKAKLDDAMELEGMAETGEEVSG
jgi:hypothetical protein